ncbi:MAG TPA: hypothetical protein VMW87_06445 [Spirochaetia bacterium]|nr:hypothetical protein [Spirochaetia bacterium]
MVHSAGRAVVLAGPFAAMLFGIPSILFTLRMRRFDRLVGRRGIRAASRWLLTHYTGTAKIDRRGSRSGETEIAGNGAQSCEESHVCEGTLIVVNHPGVVDALSLLASLDRDDVTIVAIERRFFTCLPQLNRHVIFVPREPRLRVATVRRILARLKGGHVVVLFAAGEIEPDPAFADGDGDILKPWTPVIGLIVQRSIAENFPLSVLPTLISRVVPNRARRSIFVRRQRTSAERDESAALHVLIRGKTSTHHPRVVFGEKVPASTLARGTPDARLITESVRNSVRLLQDPPRNTDRRFANAWG